MVAEPPGPDNRKSEPGTRKDTMTTQDTFPNHDRRAVIEPSTVGAMGTTTEPVRRAADRLTVALRLNAAFSAVTGLAAAVAGRTIASVFGIAPAWIVHGLGVGLLLFAATLLVAARRPARALPTEAAIISAADLGWVGGTVVVVALGWLSTSGAVVMGLLGLVVLDLAVIQLWTRHRLQQALMAPAS